VYWYVNEDLNNKELFDMKSGIDPKIKHGCCYPESEINSSQLTKTLAINPSSSISHVPHSPLPAFDNEERKAVEAYNLKLEQWRSMAIDLARQHTIR